MEPAIRTRRAPPPFRRATVVATAERSARLRRVTIEGSELVGIDPGLPAASVRLLLPHHGELVLPTWDGNEFRHADGVRPALRTLTPLAVDPIAGRLDVEIVLHGSGPMATWATAAEPGDPVAISGTGRGYEIDSTASSQVLAGDESALPAISTLLAALAPTARASVVVEVARPDGRCELPGPAGAEVSWHDLPAGAPPGAALVTAVRALEIEPSARVWAAGEAAAVQRIRRHLFDERGVERASATVRGYWKHGRAEAG